jgi:hypothetical protein
MKLNVLRLVVLGTCSTLLSLSLSLPLVNKQQQPPLTKHQLTKQEKGRKGVGGEVVMVAGHGERERERERDTSSDHHNDVIINAL